MRRALGSVAFFVCLGIVRAAGAQALVPPVALVAPLGLGTTTPASVLPSPLLLGEPTGARGDLDPWLASVPLRLSLTGSIFPIGSSFEQCSTRTEAAGNSVSGFPIQRWHAMALAPRLTLHGFSVAGCPVDGGLGGGLTYAVPVRPSLWVVPSAGFYAVPPHSGVLPARTSADVRVDVVKARQRGGTLQLGIEQKFGTSNPGSPVMVTFGMTGF